MTLRAGGAAELEVFPIGGGDHTINLFNAIDASASKPDARRAERPTAAVPDKQTRQGRAGR